MNNNNLLDNNKLYKEDSSSFLASLIAFFIPTIGVILYFLKRKEAPLLAKSFKNGVITNIIFYVVFIILFILMFLFIFFNLLIL